MPAITAKSPARSRPSRKSNARCRPPLLQRLEQEIAASGDGRFSLGCWLAGLADDELQQIEVAARHHRGEIFSFLFADPQKVAAIASRIQDAEGVTHIDDDKLPTPALLAQNIVLETLVQAERLSRQGLLVIEGELSMREDSQAVFSLTTEGQAQGVALPDLAAAHAWRTPAQLAWGAFEEARAKPKAVCAACGQTVPALGKTASS